MDTKMKLLKQLQQLEAAEPTVRISCPGDIIPSLSKYIYAEVEFFLCVTLNGAHNIIQIHEITKGLVNRTMVHPREVYRPAIADNAVSIILVHNHPSGSIVASTEDNDITGRLKKAGEIIGIPVLDHLIISKSGYYSYLASNKL